MLIELMLAAVITVDFTQPTGPVKPLHGVNNCPIRLGSTQDEFKEAGIPFCRLHDTGGMFGCGAFVDIPNVFPDFDADETDPANYYFNYTDRLLEPLVKAGTEPFYRLGVTIENAWAVCSPRRNLPPKDYAKWARICEQVIRHYTDGWANGYRWKMRYWEIWNEPEGEGCWQGTQAEFNELYCVAAKHLKAKFPHLKIGGPGTIGFYSIDDPERIPWHDDLITYQNDFFAKVKAERAPLDFYAWHLYTDEPDRIARHAEYARELLDRNGFAATESFLDEWNYPHRDWDGMKEAKGAAFVASAFCLMQQGPVDKAMYYDAQPTRHYCGLFYFPNGKTTPCYETFRKWNRLYQDRSAFACAFPSNGVYAAASAGERTKHILLVNYGLRSQSVELRLTGAELAEFGLTDGRLDLRPNEVRLLQSPVAKPVDNTALFQLPALGVTNVVGAWKREIPEGRHVALFTQRIQIEQNPAVRYVLDLGDMRGRAKVTIGATEYPVLWRPPYCLEVTAAVRRGRYGRLETTIEVTPPDPSVEPSLSTNITVRAVAGAPVPPFSEWPAGKEPATVAGRIIDLFLSTTPWGYFPKGYAGAAPYSPDHIAYPIASLWVNALDCARLAGDIESEKRLVAALEPVYGPRKDIQTEVNHVDFTIFGAVPLAIYSKTGDRRARELGLKYADFQFAKPEPPFKPAHDPNSPERQLELWRLGLSHQSRLWLDDLYMISLLQFEAYKATGRREYLERAAHETAYYLERLQREDGLFEHAVGVPFVWGRGAGWGAAAMTMALELLPESDPLYGRIRPRYLKMMAALRQHQRASGLWGQLVDDAESWDETSGSAMFAYAMITGVKRGWLPAAEYAERAEKAYLALVGQLDEYGNLKGVCIGTNRRNSREWYMQRPTTVGDTHGQAAMLWVCHALMR